MKLVLVKQSKNWTSLKKNIRNLTKFKSPKNSTQYKKSVKNLIKFKIVKRSSFLNLAAKLDYTQLI